MEPSPMPAPRRRLRTLVQALMLCVAACDGMPAHANDRFATAPAASDAASISSDVTLARGGDDPTLPQIDIEDDGPHRDLREKNRALDEARDKALLPKFGASSYEVDRDAVDALPQGKDTPIDKVLLQAPGVSYDSAASNPDFHVRNEYANVQYRINGIQLPDGVSGLGPVLETGFIGKMVLLDGALPAQYGLRTAGVVDITAKSQFAPGANLDIYGGSHATVSPSLEAGGSRGATQFFLTARYLQSEEGMENAMPTLDPLHDRSSQSKLFGYGSTLLGGASRITYVAGSAVGRFQIPDVAGLAPLGDYGSATAASAGLDEHETDRFYFAIAALQTSSAQFDSQFSVFSRYASVDFVPDVAADLTFNNVASAVVRRSLLDGIQFDLAYHPGGAHTVRTGLALAAEQTMVDDLSTVLPLGQGAQVLPSPLTVNDQDSRIGRSAGAYVQDEWTLGEGWTLNTGLRFDQLEQFVSASQWSPRVALVYQPAPALSVHAGYARYFTPPMQAQATPTTLSLFRNTTQAPAVDLDDPVLPERSHYLDLGAEVTVLPGLTLGTDVYGKRATDQLDDGQFGQAVVLTQFNYAHGCSRGWESKLSYVHDDLRAYANVSLNATRAQSVVSNQYLFTDPVEFAYLASHPIYTDDDQQLTASAGASWRRGALLASLDGIFGSGLRTGFANQQHVPGYTQWNAAAARDFAPWGEARPLTLRLSVVNLFDHSYLLRSGTGIGEFAPQYGPRRGFFLGMTQAF